MESDATESIKHISSISEYKDAFGLLVGLAVRNIAIFDFNLEHSAIDLPERTGTLRKFLLLNPRNTLSIVVHDPSFIIRYCPRLQTLLRQFSHGVFIQQTDLEAKKIYDPFLVVDTQLYLRRFHYDSPRGIFGLTDQTANENLRTRFQEIWDNSTPAITATTLGL